MPPDSRKTAETVVPESVPRLDVHGADSEASSVPGSVPGSTNPGKTVLPGGVATVPTAFAVALGTITLVIRIRSATALHRLHDLERDRNSFLALFIYLPLSADVVLLFRKADPEHRCTRSTFRSSGQRRKQTAYSAVQEF